MTPQCVLLFYTSRIYAVECSKLNSSVIYHHTTRLVTPDESGNYSKLVGL